MASYIDTDSLPPQFPTHRHDAQFWEMLGRTVATFGFLEEMLAKAIFAFTGNMPVPSEDSQKTFDNWISHLENVAADPLGQLIDKYKTAIVNYQRETPLYLDELIEKMKEAASLRNALCHGSWGLPDQSGASALWYVDRTRGSIKTKIDLAYLSQVQKHVSELACTVINTVTEADLQFPGWSSSGTRALR